MPGVVDYVNAADIPNINSIDGVLPVQIFAETRSYYAGQPVGLIIADTYEHAR